VEAVLGDKGHDSNDLAGHIGEHFKAVVVIPSRENATEPREIDRELYKARNKIERSISRAKHYRRVATRYDKTARNYMSFLHIASIMTLLL